MEGQRDKDGPDVWDLPPHNPEPRADHEERVTQAVLLRPPTLVRIIQNEGTLRGRHGSEEPRRRGRHMRGGVRERLLGRRKAVGGPRALERSTDCNDGSALGQEL